jgi:hypothetical protein
MAAPKQPAPEQTTPDPNTTNKSTSPRHLSQHLPQILRVRDHIQGHLHQIGLLLLLINLIFSKLESTRGKYTKKRAYGKTILTAGNGTEMQK